MDSDLIMTWGRDNRSRFNQSTREMKRGAIDAPMTSLTHPGTCGESNSAKCLQLNLSRSFQLLLGTLHSAVVFVSSSFSTLPAI